MMHGRSRRGERRQISGCRGILHHRGHGLARRFLHVFDSPGEITVRRRRVDEIEVVEVILSAGQDRLQPRAVLSDFGRDVSNHIADALFVRTIAIRPVTNTIALSIHLAAP